jgi:predicted Ser/Thr protein kinase
MTDHPNIKVLHASVDPENESEFRILVNNKTVKYLTIDAGLYNVDDMCFSPMLIELLPAFPYGDWNEGLISRDATTGTAYFAKVTKTNLPGIETTWHPVFIHHLELKIGRTYRSNVYEATCNRFESVVVAKLARFPWEIPQLEAETAAYGWISDRQIGPKFLGHVTEEGRVIGFVMERIADCRTATVDDLSMCRSALSKLHQLGIKHGDINKHNFLIHDSKATIIDFDSASQSASAAELVAELEGLQEQLEDTSGRGGRIVHN